MKCSGSCIRPTFIVHSCSQLFSITLLIYILLFGPRVYFPSITHRVSTHSFTSVFSTPQGFTSLPLTPRSSPHVSVILSLHSRFLLCLCLFYGTSTFSLPSSTGWQFPVERLNQDPTWRLILRWELPVSSFR